jgi:hypothetical protein
MLGLLPPTHATKLMEFFSSLLPPRGWLPQHALQPVLGAPPLALAYRPPRPPLARAAAWWLPARPIDEGPQIPSFADGE